jgi:hypothetical protein
MKKLLSAFTATLLTSITAAAAPNVTKLSQNCSAGNTKACVELAELANTAGKWEIRAAAAAVLADPEVLTRVAITDEIAEVRRAALRNPALGEKALELAPFCDAEVTQRAKDPELLERIVREKTVTAEVRRAALRNPALGEKARELAPFYDAEVTRTVSDPELLERIVRTKDVSGGPRETAFRALQDRGRLKAIAADATVEDSWRHKAEQRFLALEPDEAAVLLVTHTFGDLTKGAWPVGCANSQSVHVWTLHHLEGDLPDQPYPGVHGMVSPDTLEEEGLGAVGRLFLRPGSYSAGVGLSTRIAGGHASAGVDIHFTVRAGHVYCVAGGVLGGGSWKPQVMELSDMTQASEASPIPLIFTAPNDKIAYQSKYTAPGTWVQSKMERPDAKRD